MILNHDMNYVMVSVLVQCHDLMLWFNVIVYVVIHVMVQSHSSCRGSHHSSLSAV